MSREEWEKLIREVAYEVVDEHVCDYEHKENRASAEQAAKEEVT